ncbi:MAG: glycosyltransferase family 1 protein, partial [Legionella sp.]
RVFTVPNMIDIPSSFSYKAPRESTIPVIGVCARLAHLKGVDVFIEALAELKRRGINFHAKIAGDGKEKESYKELIQHLDLEQEVTLLGWITDRKSFYESIDIFCLPSREEAFGLVILEGMMHSLPMVLSDLSGPREIVADSQAALLVPPATPQRLADSLQSLIKDYGLRAELAENAFKRVQFYSSKNVGPILQQVLTQICKNG